MFWTVGHLSCPALRVKTAKTWLRASERLTREWTASHRSPEPLEVLVTWVSSSSLCMQRGPKSYRLNRTGQALPMPLLPGGGLEEAVGNHSTSSIRGWKKREVPDPLDMVLVEAHAG